MARSGVIASARPRAVASTLRPERRRGSALRAVLVGTLVAVGLLATRAAAQGFAAGISRSRQPGRDRRLGALRAEDEGKVTDGLVGAIKDNFNVPQETKVDGEFATPFDGLFGFGGGGEDPDPVADEDFVDSSDEANYVTVPVEKPFGMGVGDATDEGGVEVTSVQPGSNAEATGKIKTGYQLIAIDEEPVYGKTVPDIGKVVGEKEGVFRLTFFKGGAKFFYGKLGPSSSWLSKFIDGLTEY